MKPDDGFVLHEGELWKPENLSRAAAQVFKGWGGRHSQSVIRRYSRCYPHRDATTPTFQEFKRLLKGYRP
jgi:hypothetical protein